MSDIRYRLTAPAYLRMKNNPKGDPIYIETDTEIGEGTPFDFDGPPTLAMQPLTEAAEQAHQEYLESVESGIPMTVKGGAAKPFDPADPNSDSGAEKEAAKKQAEADAKRAAELDAKAADLDKRIADLQKREKALADAEAKATPPKAPLPDAKK